MCRTCRTEASARSRKKLNPERRSGQHKAWRERHPNYYREYGNVNRDRINARRRARHADDPEKHRGYARDYWHNREWAASLMRKYGITAEQYDQMLTQQSGKCGLCSRNGNVGGKRLAVDHYHATNRVRGLLCNPCNAMLGSAQDSAERLIAAAAYLLQHADGPAPVRAVDQKEAA